MEPDCGLEHFLQQVAQRDVSGRLQVGQELVDYLSDPRRSSEVVHDHKSQVDGIVDELTGWINSSNFKVRREVQPSHSCIVWSWTPLPQI